MKVTEMDQADDVMIDRACDFVSKVCKLRGIPSQEKSEVVGSKVYVLDKFAKDIAEVVFDAHGGMRIFKLWDDNE